MFDEIKADPAKTIYFLGVIAGSIGIGTVYGEGIGWMAAGAGLIAYALVTGMLSYLNSWSTKK